MYLTLDQALLQEPKQVAFVVFEGKVIGRKLGRELFLEFEIDLELAKHERNNQSLQANRLAR